MSERENERNKRINEAVRSGAMNRSLGIDAETVARRTGRRYEIVRYNGETDTYEVVLSNRSARQATDGERRRNQLRPVGSSDSYTVREMEV